MSTVGQGPDGLAVEGDVPFPTEVAAHITLASSGKLVVNSPAGQRTAQLWPGSFVAGDVIGVGEGRDGSFLVSINGERVDWRPAVYGSRSSGDGGGVFPVAAMAGYVGFGVSEAVLEVIGNGRQPIYPDPERCGEDLRWTPPALAVPAIGPASADAVPSECISCSAVDLAGSHALVCAGCEAGAAGLDHNVASGTVLSCDECGFVIRGILETCLSCSGVICQSCADTHALRGHVLFESAHAGLLLGSAVVHTCVMCHRTADDGEEAGGIWTMCRRCGTFLCGPCREACGVRYRSDLHRGRHCKSEEHRILSSPASGIRAIRPAFGLVHDGPAMSRVRCAVCNVFAFASDPVCVLICVSECVCGCGCGCGCV